MEAQMVRRARTPESISQNKMLWNEILPVHLHTSRPRCCWRAALRCSVRPLRLVACHRAKPPCPPRQHVCLTLVGHQAHPAATSLPALTGRRLFLLRHPSPDVLACSRAQRRALPPGASIRDPGRRRSQLTGHARRRRPRHELVAPYPAASEHFARGHGIRVGCDRDVFELFSVYYMVSASAR